MKWLDCAEIIGFYGRQLWIKKLGVYWGMQNKEHGVKLLFGLASEKLWGLGFAIVFLCGAYLRFRAPTFQSYWDDELFSAAISDPNNTLSQVVGLTVNDVHPPLFQVLLWCWFKIFGFSEMTGRVFPAIFGTLSIFAMFLLGCEVGDRKVGFISALICAVNIFHLRYSQEVRSYSLLFFLSALSLFFFIRVIKKPERVSLIAYIVAATALAYTHFFGIFILLAQAVFFLLARATVSNEFKTAGIVIGAALLITLSPLVLLVVKNAEIGAFWIKRPEPDFSIEYFQKYFGNALIAIGAALALLYGAARNSRGSSRDVVRLFLLCIAMVFILPYMRSLIGTPILTGRNTIAALPAIFILMAIGFAGIRGGVFQAMALLSFVMLSISLIFNGLPYYSTITKPQIREAAQALIAAKPDADKVYAAPEVVRNFNVYFALFNAPFRAQSLDNLYKVFGENKLAPSRFWLIDGRTGGPSFIKAIAPNSRALRVLEEANFHAAGFRLVEREE